MKAAEVTSAKSEIAPVKTRGTKSPLALGMALATASLESAAAMASGLEIRVRKIITAGRTAVAEELAAWESAGARTAFMVMAARRAFASRMKMVVSAVDMESAAAMGASARASGGVAIAT